MRLRTSCKCRTDNIELKGLTKKLPFRIPSSVKDHSLTSFCIKMYVDMACIDNISIARSKRVNEKIVLCYTVQDEDQFPCKSSGLWFTWIISYDRYGLHYNVLLGHIIGCFTRNKRVNE